MTKLSRGVFHTDSKAIKDAERYIPTQEQIDRAYWHIQEHSEFDMQHVETTLQGVKIYRCYKCQIDDAMLERIVGFFDDFDSSKHEPIFQQLSRALENIRL